MPLLASFKPGNFPVIGRERALEVHVKGLHENLVL